MAEKTIFPREEKADVLFNKILNDPWACEKPRGLSAIPCFATRITIFHYLPLNFPRHFLMLITTEICQLFLCNLSKYIIRSAPEFVSDSVPF